MSDAVFGGAFLPLGGGSGEREDCRSPNRRRIICLPGNSYLSQIYRLLLFRMPWRNR